MSLIDFAAHLGVSPRIVSVWEAKGTDTTPRPVNQAALDRSLSRLEHDELTRFIELMPSEAFADAEGVVSPSTQQILDRACTTADATTAEQIHQTRVERPGSVEISVGAGHQLGSLLESGAGTDRILMPARTSTGEVILVSMPRRTFIAGAGAGALGMAAGAALSSKLLAAVFVHSEIDHIKFFRDKRMNIIESDNIYGSASTLPEVLGALDRMQALRDAKVVDSNGILRLMAMYAETAAWQYQDQRMFPEAQHWAEKALTWSHQLGDTYYIGLSLVRMSQLASDRGDGASSGELAVAASRAAPRASLFTAAAVAYNAHALALEADASASARAYDTARTLVGQADTDPAWGFFLDHSYIDACQAHSLTTLGDHPAAIAQFDDATARMQSGYPRDRGVYLARSAVAHMAAGQIEPAAALGTQALQIGVASGSGRIMERVITLAGMIDPASIQTGVHDFVAAFEQWKAASCPDRM
ncbi:hypothetical protein [Nocardia takedensis]|uniref:hypothetical protein n=1 Tax=Nocardia takedensis TaxID=259390 RepID=UPI0012F6B213|nr:hypothetical protein [Nocardia takedensis]